MSKYCPPTKPSPSCDASFNAIYLGDVHENQYMDRYEGLPGTESAWTLNGQNFKIGAFDEHYVRITAHDTNNNGSLHGENGIYNHKGFEQFTTDKPVNVTGTDKYVSKFNFDAVAKFAATITYADGTTGKAILTVIQDDLGRTFAVPSLDEKENLPLEQGKISNVRLDKFIPTPLNTNDLAVCRPDIKIVCFASGTQIMTPDGPRNVEDLKVGDLVMTADRGAQEVRWAGARTLDAIDLASESRLIPVRIKAGALGGGLPKRDLVVSPQHRVLIASDIALEMTGEKEVLVAAKHLLGMPGVELAADLASVTYHHILFDNHEIVFSEGLRSESLFTGKEAMKAMTEDAQREITLLFPQLKEEFPVAGVRPFTKGRVARDMAASMQLAG